MKPRPELLLAIVLAAGVIFLLLDVSVTRGVKREGREQAAGTASDPPAPEPEMVLHLEPSTERAAEPAKRAEARSEPPARPVVPPPTSRGRLVDQATLEPIPDALVATSRLNDWTDKGGWFDTGDVLDELDDLLVVNVTNDTSTYEVSKTSWTRLPNAWQVPLAIGPTYRLRFTVEDVTDAEVPNPETWEARLRRDSGSDDGWHRLRKGPPPYLRTSEPFRALGPGERVWLEARSQDGQQEGRGEVLSLVGVHDVEIDCRPRAVLRGRVVDEYGVPWNDIEVEALQLSEGSEETLYAQTGIDGTYQLSASEPGQMQLLLRLRSHTRTRKLKLAVPRGVTQAPDFVLERGPTGSIKGRLLARSEEVPVFGSLRLRALDGSGFEVVRDFMFWGRKPAVDLSGGAVRQQALPMDRPAFVFEGLPPGGFELSAFSKDGFACSPASIQVRAPAEGLTFFFENAVEQHPYVLTLLDAESGAVLESILAEVRVAGAWSDRSADASKGEALITLAEGVGFEWRATSPGYRMAHGNAADFRLEGKDLVARRELQRGFSVRLRMRDRSEGPERFDGMTSSFVRWGTSTVAGAEVLADGVLVATSDGNGIAELELPQQPNRIEARHAGWRVLDSPSFREGTAKGFPTSEVWMVRE